MESDTVVEKVARFIADADGIRWEWVTPAARTRYLNYAKAAVFALQEPSETMIDAGVDAVRLGGVIPAYRAMIGEALRP